MAVQENSERAGAKLGACPWYSASDPIDPEMAGIFTRYWDPDSEYFKPALNVGLDGRGGGFLCNATIGRVQLMKELADLNMEASTAPVGFWMKPYAALAIHRRGDWMVSTKGWSQYVWDFEGHFKTWAAVEENVYARYLSYGHMQVLAKGNPVNAADSGCDIDRGWDWNRWPGTTTKHLPLSMLYSPTETYACRMFTDETFVGGVSSEAKNGIPHLDEEAVATESTMQKVYVDLHGPWKIKASSNEARVKELHSNTTVIEFDCIDGKTIEIVLLRSYCSEH